MAFEYLEEELAAAASVLKEDEEYARLAKRFLRDEQVELVISRVTRLQLYIYLLTPPFAIEEPCDFVSSNS